MSSFIAMRRTAQGTVIKLWPDGAITWALGCYVKNSPHARTDVQREEALSAGWLVMGEVELYDDEEVPDLIAAARWTANRGGDPGMMRERLHRGATVRPVWTTLETDRDGKPTVQCWKLPRLRWPGLAVWREKGRYSVWSEIGRSGSYSPSGLSFANLRELTGYLETVTLNHKGAA